MTLDLLGSLSAQLDALPAPHSSGALAVLARHYAEEIEAAEDRATALKDLGPKLASVVIALGLVPGAKPVGGVGASSAAPASADQLAARRQGDALERLRSRAVQRGGA